MNPLDRNTLDLIGKHSRALSEDSIEHQYHHLILLDALIKVGLDQIGVVTDWKDKSS